MWLSKIIQEINTEQILYNGVWDREIDCLQTDSRERAKNALFVCIEGMQIDSHKHVKNAEKNGAVAIVANKPTETHLPQIIVKDTRAVLGQIASVFYGNPSSKLTVVGITGTNGKTTTSYMLAEIWKAENKKVGVIGTLGIVYNNVKKSCNLTTPDPIFLHKTLAEMFDDGVEYVVMEVSAHALYYKKTLGVQFKACIFTNLTQDHLDFFKDMEEYKRAKMSLFASEVCPIAIVNGDDEVGREIGRLRDETGQKTLFYGMGTPTDCFAVITNESLYGTDCMFNLEDKLCRASLSLVGRHNVYNALAASVCAIETGTQIDSISRGIANVKMIPGRLQQVGSLKGAEIYVDFAHTPDGLDKSLDTLRQHCKGRLVCVFGCGGNRDKSKRPIMGEIVAKKADFAVLTSDNPRYEDPLDILSDIEKGYRRYSVCYVVVPDRKIALDYALDYLKKGDVLLVAGKGGEEFQEIMGIKYPFNDNTVLEKLLREKSKIGF